MFSTKTADIFAHPIEDGAPILRTDINTLVLKLDRDDVLSLIGEVMKAVGNSPSWNKGINLVIETKGGWYPQTYFEDANDS